MFLTKKKNKGEREREGCQSNNMQLKIFNKTKICTVISHYAPQTTIIKIMKFSKKNIKLKLVVGSFFENK